jgi:hypothetical protein
MKPTGDTPFCRKNNGKNEIARSFVDESGFFREIFETFGSWPVYFLPQMERHPLMLRMNR